MPSSREPVLHYANGRGGSSWTSACVSEIACEVSESISAASVASGSSLAASFCRSEVAMNEMLVSNWPKPSCSAARRRSRSGGDNVDATNFAFPSVADRRGLAFRTFASGVTKEATDRGFISSESFSMLKQQRNPDVPPGLEQIASNAIQPVVPRCSHTGCL